MGRRGLLAALVGIVVILALTPQATQTLIQTVYPDFSYTNSPFPVLTSTVRPGQPVNVEVGRCNRTGQTLHYTVDRYLLDESGVLIPLDPLTRQVVMDPGCSLTESPVTHIVPTGTQPGIYRLMITAHIPMIVLNATANRTVEAESQPFRVAR